MAEDAYHPLYLRGVRQFNERRFFESHETWEQLWISQSGPSREFCQGLIQAASRTGRVGSMRPQCPRSICIRPR